MFFILYHSDYILLNIFKHIYIYKTIAKVDVQLYQEYNSHIIHMTILWIILLMICTYIIIRYIYIYMIYIIRIILLVYPTIYLNILKFTQYSSDIHTYY
jgi:hypothetical protein